MSVMCKSYTKGICPPCIHSEPHEPDSVARMHDWPHLKEDTERVCSLGRCCSRPIDTECIEVIERVLA